jgi:hypothetical protein
VASAAAAVFWNLHIACGLYKGASNWAPTAAAWPAGRKVAASLESATAISAVAAAAEMSPAPPLLLLLLLLLLLSPCGGQVLSVETSCCSRLPTACGAGALAASPAGSSPSLLSCDAAAALSAAVCHTCTLQ